MTASQELSPEFFIKNRSKLYDLLIPGAAVLIASARHMPRNGSQYYPFRQDSDFFYLTGIREPGCLLLLLPRGDKPRFREILYITRPDEHAVRWEGVDLDVTAATKISGISEIRYTDDFESDLRDHFSGLENIYYGAPSRGMVRSNVPANEALFRKEIEQRFPSLDDHSLGPALMRLRMMKDPEEIKMIKRAIGITGDAFVRVLKQLKPGMKEYEVEAIMTHHFIAEGAGGHAFHPIVASGSNALVLHYSRNSGVCRDGDLLLMDFGSEWNCYASDISRTIPVNGRYSLLQRRFYEANLNVMRKAMPLMVAGNTLAELNREVGALWEEEHIRLGLYSRSEARKTGNSRPAWTRYFWHGNTHSIGLDVHDPFDQALEFRPGMVFSCEPGIYIQEEGMGIRLENDVLIGEGGPVNLSEDIPIDPDAIEVIMNSG